MDMKPRLKLEGSMTLSVALAGMVFGLYKLNLDNVSVAAATDANHPLLETSRKKAGYTALVAVGAMALLTRDPNMVILGGAAIIAMEVHYRHAIMVHPDTGRMTPVPASAYQPAENVVPLSLQAEPS